MDISEARSPSERRFRILDEISRQRALTEEESLELERAMRAADWSVRAKRKAA